MSRFRGRHLSGRLIDAVTSPTAMLGERGPVVRTLGSHDETRDCVRLLGDAWALLELHGATYVRWFQRCVRRVVVAGVFRARASYHAASQSVFLRSDSADAHDALGLAAILTHECSHARISATLGTVVLVGTTKARVEARCVANQLQLLTAVDGNHYLVDWSRSLQETYRRR